MATGDDSCAVCVWASTTQTHCTLPSVQATAASESVLPVVIDSCVLFFLPQCQKWRTPTNCFLSLHVILRAQVRSCRLGRASSQLPSRSLASRQASHAARCSTPPCHDWRRNDTAETHRHSRLALRHTSTASHLSDPTPRGIKTLLSSTLTPSPAPRPALDTCCSAALSSAREPLYESQPLSHSYQFQSCVRQLISPYVSCCKAQHEKQRAQDVLS